MLIIWMIEGICILAGHEDQHDLVCEFGRFFVWDVQGGVDLYWSHRFEDPHNCRPLPWPIFPEVQYQQNHIPIWSYMKSSTCSNVQSWGMALTRRFLPVNFAFSRSSGAAGRGRPNCLKPLAIPKQMFIVQLLRPNQSVDLAGQVLVPGMHMTVCRKGFFWFG